jgi:hypothetical protein
MSQESEVGIASEGDIWEWRGLVQRWEFHDWLWREGVKEEELQSGLVVCFA